MFCRSFLQGRTASPLHRQLPLNGSQKFRLRQRNLSQSLRRQSQSQRERNAVGVFTPTSAALFIATGVGLFFYFRHEKQKLLEEREKERSSRQYGRPNIGGPLSLTSSNGEPFTEKNMLGKWSLVYFGFTNCPDICPAELDKVGSVLNKVETDLGKIFLPIFISVDPARDTPERIKRYLADFHPSFIGLVGPYDVTKAACKAYRVYFSTPPNADPKGDYLVDHSIFVYLMDPEGHFVEAFGQTIEADQIVTKIKEEVVEWEKENGGKISVRG
ncbi:Cu-binding protein [Leucoagaricus gongylophorus]